MAFDPSPPADVATAPSDATTTSSGLTWKLLSPGSGARPTAAASVTVHYSGWTTDGKLFDSSRRRGSPATFPLDGVIKGWTEGVQLMDQGASMRFWIPAGMAYGENPGAGRPGGPLVFDIELLSIKEPAQAPAAPRDVAAPPDDATFTSSGLSYRVLRPGEGAKPGPTSRVTVHYSGWTTDGTLFDSSVTRGQPATFPLNGVIKGWTEGVQKMTLGEKTRFWIPAGLAYGRNPGRGRPGGMLVFDIELLIVH
jgi:FKBP-type peptidyl-prolyl cis-trans isomerase